MNLDELRSAQAKERRKDSLQHLRDAFYDDVAAYVADLRAARDRRAEQVENPFADDDIRRLSDELETTEEVAKALYERRVGKVVKLASFAAADMSVDTDGMTSEERALFDDLVSRIRSNKSTVLATLAGDAPADSTVESDASTTDAVEAPEAGASTPASEPPTTQTDGPADTANSSHQDTPAAPGTTATSPDNSTESSPTGDGADVLTGAMGATTTDAPSPGDPSSDAGVDTTSSAESTPPDPHSPPPGATETEMSTPSEPTANDLGASDRADEPKPNATQTDGGATVATAGDATTAGDGTTVGNGATAGEKRATDREASVDRETVRITCDVGSILGVDEREYELASDDVVTLPAANATPLVERDAAERIE